MIPKLPPLPLGSSQNRPPGVGDNRSFPSKRNNLPFQGFLTSASSLSPNRSFVKQALGRFKENGINENKHSSIQSNEGSMITTTTIACNNTTSSNHTNSDSCNSSFWNEWAEEMIQQEQREVGERTSNNESNNSSSLKGINQQETQQQLMMMSSYESASYYAPQDPSFVGLEDIPDPSFSILADTTIKSMGVAATDQQQKSIVQQEEETNNDDDNNDNIVQNSSNTEPEESLIQEYYPNPSFAMPVDDGDEEEEQKKNDKSQSIHQQEPITTESYNTDDEEEERARTSYLPTAYTTRQEHKESYYTSTSEEISEEEEREIIVVDASINTYTAMNLSQQTTDDDETNDLSFQAMEFSNAAADLLQEKKYLEAITTYQKAVDCYEEQSNILALVNAAGCCRNMCAVARTLKQYEEASNYLKKAETLYFRAREAVEIKSTEPVLTLDGKLLEDSRNGAPDTSASCTEEFMCLDEMILETLQHRATFLIECQNDKEKAVDCLEQILKQLMHLDKLHQWDALADYAMRYEGVSFSPLSKEHHTEILKKNLLTLGKYYRDMATTHICSMVLFEDALDILQNRQEENPENDELIHATAKVLRYLSEVYFRRKELDKSVDALHDATAVKLLASGEPCIEALQVMEQMGSANEDMNNWDKALSCYEQALFARCKYYGNTHINVAQSLIDVARVMEKKDGSTAESSELYRAANAIYALQAPPATPKLDDNVKTIIGLIPDVIKQGRCEKAIDDLHKCLAAVEEKKGDEQSLDKAQILFDLGRAYMAKQDYENATKYLMEAVVEVGNANEEDMFDALQRVEFLQREQQSPKGIIDITLDEGDYNQDFEFDAFNRSMSLQQITFQLLNNEESATAAAAISNEEYEIDDRIVKSLVEPRQSIQPNIMIVTKPNKQQEENENTEIELMTTDPRHAILYRSFSIDHDTTTTKAIEDNDHNWKIKQEQIAHSVRKNINPKKGVKLAKKVAKKIKALQKAIKEREKGDNVNGLTWGIFRGNCLHRNREKLTDTSIDRNYIKVVKTKDETLEVASTER